MFDDIKSTTTK